jgi:hypothetical protein
VTRHRIISHFLKIMVAGPLQYGFIIKKVMSLLEVLHNHRIYESMFGTHPFADRTPDVSGSFYCMMFANMNGNRDNSMSLANQY